MKRYIRASAAIEYVDRYTRVSKDQLMFDYDAVVSYVERNIYDICRQVNLPTDAARIRVEEHPASRVFNYNYAIIYMYLASASAPILFAVYPTSEDMIAGQNSGGADFGIVLQDGQLSNRDASSLYTFLNEQVAQLANSQHKASARSKSLKWNDFAAMLKQDLDGNADPIDDQTDAGVQLNDWTQAVEAKLGVWSEPSVQSGQGEIVWYNSTDAQLSDCDYAEWKSAVYDMAETARSLAAFKTAYKNWLQTNVVG
ncbi:hypothetical protein [uncultured Duncaniella sp.]|uniref:hypothetical protein n=1 Tax=uncultured Duncaniella sp. TaxID=2768039 RepID=UPI002624483A|nr:hypothetical protein [uncultured Duncaniella sp.]